MTDFFVSTTGNDANSGSQISPKRTWQGAAAVAMPGDTVYIRGGTYVGADGRVVAPRSGTALAPINFEGFESEPAIYNGNDVQNSDFRIENRSWVNVRKLEMLNCMPAGIWVLGELVQGNHIFERLHIHDIDSDIQGDNTGCIRLDYTENVTVRNNNLHDVLVQGVINNNANCVQSYRGKNLLIEHNHMHDTTNGMFHKEARGAGEKGSIVRYNLMHDLKRGVFHSVAGGGSPAHHEQEVYQNIMYACVRGVDVDPYDSVAISQGLYIHHNVFDCVPEDELGCVSLIGYEGIEIWNNIFYLAAAGRDITTHWPGGWNALIESSNYNLFHDSATFTLRGYHGTAANYDTLAAWVAATGFDANSLQTNPLFVDRAGRDYHLQAGSPARLSGRDGDNMGAYLTGNETIGIEAEVAPPVVAPYSFIARRRRRGIG